MLLTEGFLGWVKPKVKTFRFYRVFESERRVEDSIKPKGFMLAPASNSNKAPGFRVEGWM